MKLSKEEFKQRLEDLKVMSNEEFAEKYGVKRENVSRIRSRFGLVQKKQEPSKQEAEQVVQLRNDGENIDTIIKKTGITYWYVKKILYDNGLSEFNPREKYKPLKPEEAEPMFYNGRGDTCELEPVERKRYEELKRWKEENYRKLFIKNR